MTPPYSLCGYAVEWLRSCYSSEWRLTGDSTALTPGRYVFSPPDTPFFEEWHSFGSRNYTTDDFQDSDPVAGEVRGTRQRWFNGATPEVFPRTMVIGHPDQLEHVAGLDGFCAWHSTAENGAVWELDGATAAVSFEDSLNCGGTNDLTQRGAAQLVIYTSRDRQMIIEVEGRVERQQATFDTCVVYVNDQPEVSLHGTDEGLGCMMADVSGSATVTLQPGRHLVEVVADTVDGRFHVDCFFETALTFDPPFAAPPDLWQGVPVACYRSPEGFPVFPPFLFSDITQPSEWLRWALLIQQVYDDLPTAEATLQAYLGINAGVIGYGSPGELVPKCVIGVLPSYTVIAIEGRTNDLQSVFFALTTYSGQVSFSGFGTNLAWLLASNVLFDRIEASLPNNDARILLVGHSYGGGLAALMAGRLRLAHPNREIDVLTFGSVIPGNRDLADLIDDCNHVRLSNTGDPVPSLPPDVLRFPVLLALVGPAILAGWGFYDQPHGQRRIDEDGNVFLDEQSTLDYLYLLEAVAAAVSGDPLTPAFAHEIAEYIRRIRLTIAG